MDKAEALRAYLESTGDPDDAGLGIEDEGWALALSDGREYIVVDGAERADWMEDYLRDESAQYFNADFLAEQTGLPEAVFSALAGVPGANTAVVACIDQTCGMASFIEAAVAADGWGHFMSAYDGEEIELEGGWYAYRHN